MGVSVSCSILSRAVSRPNVHEFVFHAELASFTRESVAKIFYGRFVPKLAELARKGRGFYSPVVGSFDFGAKRVEIRKNRNRQDKQVFCKVFEKRKPCSFVAEYFAEKNAVESNQARSEKEIRENNG